MAEICPVCNEKTGSDDHFSVEGAEGDIEVHTYCMDEFKLQPEKYGGRKIKVTGYPPRSALTEAQIKAEKEAVEQRRKEQAKDEEKKAKDEEEQAKDEEEQAIRAEANFNKLLEQAERDEASLQEIKDKSVYVKDLDMPIKSMVIFMVKWAVASIPAFIILAIIGAIFFTIFAAIFA
jgi:Fe2+ transport system protein B